MTGQQPADAGNRGIVPAENAMPSRQTVTYIILTMLRPDSGLIIGGVRAVAQAAIYRLLGGPGSRDALVAAYIRVADVLVPVDVEATELPAAVDGRTQYRIRTWLGQQLISQCELETPLHRK
ncbi:hypothetical protein E0H26_26990 [Micromonospora zingiberis]|uniref:Uncharacterized protein n=1 Tax=Micromonospora zingiberis TaxID=2053011 RepID=A0A4R0G3K1_9ACTN|nr:hypothetical protein [Micromonospora zingiberis]TCB90472.1 hypothetical protein E0H26_26990 [Micromonospora zingiberis]